MTTTNFSAGTIIASSWLNDVDDIVYRKNAEWTSAKDPAYGAVGDGVTDDASAINAALLAVEARGGGAVFLPAGTYLIGATLRIPDGCGLIGEGRQSTEIKLKNSTNANLIEKKVGDDGTRAFIKSLALNGNDANNTSGGLYWVAPSINRGPCILIEDVLINYCAPATGSGTNGAVVLEGGQWGVMRDTDITFNQNAIGLWHKGSDWMFDSVFIGPNGATLGSQSVIVQAGAGNTFKTCYFGGNGGLEQVQIQGAQRNFFIACNFDNSWENAIKFTDFSGTGANNNVFSSCIFSHAGGKTDNTYDTISLEGAATGNLFSDCVWIGAGHTSSLNRARYAISESGTATLNVVDGGISDTNHATGFKNLRATGLSVVRNVRNYNPQGVATITPGASPYSYTNQDHSPQLVYIRGGTVSDVSKNSVVLATTTGTQVWLEPGEAVVVTYSSVPTMVKDTK